MSGVAQTRMATPSCSPELHWKSPTRKATQIGGHLGSGEELEGVLAVAGAGGVGGDGAVGDGGVALVDDQGDVEGGLEGGLVEAGKGAAGVGGLELGDGVVAVRGFGEIEAAQFIVEDAGELDGRWWLCRRAADRGTVKVACCLSLSRETVAVCSLSAGLDLDRLEGDLDGVEGDGRAGLLQVHVDGLGAGVGGGLEVGRERERVVLGPDGLGQALGASGHREEGQEAGETGGGTGRLWECYCDSGAFLPREALQTFYLSRVRKTAAN